MLDDDFMTKCFEENIKGRSLRLDIYATDSEDKKDKEGIQAMCKALEDMITDDRKETAVRMLERGKMTQEEIAEDVKLPLEVVEELAKNLQTV